MYKALAALAVFCLAACGGNAVDQYNPLHPVIVGSFEHKFSELHRSSRAGICEQRFAKLHQELATELDQRSDALARTFLERRPSGTGVDPWTKPWGPITMDTRPVTEADRVDTWRYGWDTVEPLLRRAQRSDDWNLWKAVFQLSGSLLVDDYQRHGGLSMGLTDTTLPYVEELQRGLDTCLADAQCGDLKLSTGAMTYASSGNAAYARIWERLRGAPLRSVKRKAMRELSERVGVDLSFFTSLPNEAIQVRGEELHLPLDAGDFHAVRGDIQRIVEETWRGEGLQVRVDWVSRHTNPGAYRIIAHHDKGRDYVMHSDQTVNLYEGVHAKVIAHELGHVLGLPDHYYTQWDEARCGYTVSIDNDDIMSNHMTGQVTRGELDSLRAMYEIGH